MRLDEFIRSLRSIDNRSQIADKILEKDSFYFNAILNAECNFQDTIEQGDEVHYIISVSQNYELPKLFMITGRLDSFNGAQIYDVYDWVEVKKKRKIIEDYEIID